MENKLSAIQNLDVAIRARYPVILVSSTEEARVQASILGLLAASQRHARKDVFVWTMVRGFRQWDGQRLVDNAMGGQDDPIGSLLYALDHGVTDDQPQGRPAVFLFKDLSPYLQDPRVARALREVIGGLPSTARTVICLETGMNIPEDLKRQVAMIEWPLPTVDEIAVILDSFTAGLPDGFPTHLNGDREAVAKALQGLTEFQAQSVLATAAIATGRLDAGATDFIISEKARLIKASGLLEFYQPEGLSEIGGLDLLKSYFVTRRGAFTQEAAEYGLQTPKGALMVGVPGCGKSLAAKTLARLWKLPLIRLDVGALMGSLVGQSEGNLRQALKVAESAAPCVLWLDELEKGLSGVKSSGQTDGGTTARVFGSLLTWMQDKTAPVYVIATSNDISALPPELLRAGRFDDIFFVDLPNAEERAEIWRIHLSKARRDAARFDIAALVEASDGYTGSEIETAVGEALIAGFEAGREISTGDLLQAVEARVPLSQTMGEQINEIRTWAKRRARPASSTVKAQTAQAGDSRAARLDL